MTTTIRAEIIGSDCCETEGITIKASAPVLEMCRALIAAGYDPDSPLNAYRGDTLSIKVRSIGEGAMLDCQEGGGFRLRVPRTAGGLAHAFVCSTLVRPNAPESPA